MVHSNEAGFNLREMIPLPRNILHSWEISALADTGQRLSPIGLPRLVSTKYQPKG
jgi:hypothetical protein